MEACMQMTRTTVETETTKVTPTDHILETSVFGSSGDLARQFREKLRTTTETEVTRKTEVTDVVEVKTDPRLRSPAWGRIVAEALNNNQEQLAEGGEAVALTRRGRPVGRIIPIRTPAKATAQEAPEAEATPFVGATLPTLAEGRLAASGFAGLIAQGAKAVEDLLHESLEERIEREKKEKAREEREREDARLAALIEKNALEAKYTTIKTQGATNSAVEVETAALASAASATDTATIRTAVARAQAVEQLIEQPVISDEIKNDIAAPLNEQYALEGATGRFKQEILEAINHTSPSAESVATFNSLIGNSVGRTLIAEVENDLVQAIQASQGPVEVAEKTAAPFANYLAAGDFSTLDFSAALRAHEADEHLVPAMAA